MTLKETTSQTSALGKWEELPGISCLDNSYVLLGEATLSLEEYLKSLMKAYIFLNMLTMGGRNVGNRLIEEEESLRTCYPYQNNRKLIVCKWVFFIYKENWLVEYYIAFHVI
jgi:hypothetical protein